MAEYQLSEADRLPLPASYLTEGRQLGLSEPEQQRPFAHFFAPTLRPLQSPARDALLAGRVPRELGLEVDDVVRHLSAPGYQGLETGWTRTRGGTLLVACLTDMPGVTAAMWDWWFGWHSTESARYKLWHPAAHRYSGIADDRSGDRSLTDRQRYIGNVSYVDEYVGATYTRLAIRFFDPARLGFEDSPGTTHICARVGLSDVPVAAGWIVHQVRPTEDGCEMRSRFFLGHAQVLDVPPHSVSEPLAGRVLTSALGRGALAPVVTAVGRSRTPDAMGHDLLHHCASEMNHLAGFLPALHAEFRDFP